ncbi:hypothetical protein [Vibrio sp. 10N.239.312.D08]|uniref:hypothetical protein n=1 Tax=Vibrio sp. 10N.239.312.D08 TaxID=3229978 RepID=UPI003553B9B5
MKFQTKNYNQLLIQQNEGYQRIVAICRSGTNDDDDLYVAGKMPGFPTIDLLAEKKGKLVAKRLLTSSEDIKDMPTTRLFLKFDRLYFQVSFVGDDLEAGDKMASSLPRDNVGFMDETDYDLQGAGLIFQFWAFRVDAIEKSF